MGCTIGVLVGVVAEVDQDPREPSTVARDDQVLQAGIGQHGYLVAGERLHGVADHGHEGHVVELEAHRTRIEARDLEQVLHQLREPGDVGLEQVQCLTCALGHLFAVVGQHLEPGVERRQR